MASEHGYGALVALVDRIGGALWIDGVWVRADRGEGPVVVVDSGVGAVRPTPAPDRHVLVAVAPASPLLAPDPADPLVASTRVDAAGFGGFDGGLLVLEGAGEVTGAPLARVGDVTVAAADGRSTTVGGVAWLRDHLLAAGDNARFVVRALTGADAPDLVAAVHRWRSAPARHDLPPVIEAGALDWRLEDVPAAGTPLSGDQFAAAVRRRTRLLPAVVHDALLELADDGHPSGALVVRGVPVGDLPPTPDTPDAPVGKDRVSELLLLAAGRLLGQPVGYRPEHGGDVVQNLVPTPDGAGRQVSTSSEVTLAWHTEAAFHRHRPRYLLLLCLRGDPSARTTLCSVRAIAPALGLRTRSVLAEPRFRTAADESYVGHRSDRLGRPVPVLSGDPEAPQILYDADLMVGADPEAQVALDELAALVEEAHTSVVLEPGDLLVVDNTVAVHGRSPFRARYDGTDRWLQRAFVVADLAPSAAERSGRVVDTRFVA